MADDRTFLDYEYKGLMAQAWDVLRGDTSGWADRFFYLDVIQYFGQPVLDVGCGTGRLLLDYMQAGIDIDGVDNSPEMLAICRQKADSIGLAPNLYEGTMEALALPRKYRTILVPSSSLQLIIDPGQVDEALKRLLAHLVPGGGIAASIMTLWREGDPLEFEWEKSAVRDEDGAEFHRRSWSRYTPETGLEHTEDLYRLIAGGEVISEERHQRSPATRSYTQAQARGLFERAGFGRVEVYSEFTFDPVKPEDTLFVVLGQK